MGGRGSASGFPTHAPVPAPLQSASEAKDLQELAQYMKNVGQWGIYVNERSLSGQTFENVREAAAAVETIMNEFPQAQGLFHELRGDDLRNGVIANASYSGVITLSNSYFSRTEDGLNRTYDGTTAKGLHPAGTNKSHIATHEAGHILERALIDKHILSKGNGLLTQLAGADAWRKATMSGKVISEACRLAKKTPAGKGMKNDALIKSVSSYATMNRAETLAECVADYVANGANAKPLSVAVWSVLKRELG